MVPETSDPAGNDGDAELGEGTTASVARGEGLLTTEDAAGVCWGTDGDGLPQPIAPRAIERSKGAISRDGVRIVIFRLSTSAWDGSRECRTRSSRVHRASHRKAPHPRNGEAPDWIPGYEARRCRRPRAGLVVALTPVRFHLGRACVRVALGRAS